MRAKLLVSAGLAVGLAVAVWQRTNPPWPRPPAVPPPPVEAVQAGPVEVAVDVTPTVVRPAAEPPPPARTAPLTPPGWDLPRVGWAVTALAFSPDGRRVAAGSHDHLRLWDPATAEPVAAVRTDSPVNAVAFTPDGRWLVSGGSDGLIRRWHPDTLAPDGEMAGHAGAVRCLAVTPDGVMVSGGVDGTIQFWDVAARRGRWGIDGLPDGSVGWLAVAGDRVFAAGWAGHVDLAVPADPLPVRSADARGGAARVLPFRAARLAASPDGRYVAGREQVVTVGPTHVTITTRYALADAATGRTLAELGSRHESGVAFSPDGRVVVTQGGGGEWQFWEAATGRCIHRAVCMRGEPPLVFSADGRQVACGRFGGRVSFTRWPPDPDRWAREAATADPGRLWADLTGADAGAAYRAAWTLAADPPRAVPLLAERVRPVAAPDPARVARLIADLDDPDYPVREAASAELRRLGAVAGPALRAAAVRSPSAEVRRRAEAVLAAIGPGFPLRGDALRAVRVVMALETANAPAARDLLRRWAADPSADPLLAAEAGRALARLEVVNRPR